MRWTVGATLEESLRITQKARASERRVLSPVRRLVRIARFNCAAGQKQQEAFAQAHGLGYRMSVFSRGSFLPRMLSVAPVFIFQL